VDAATDKPSADLSSPAGLLIGTSAAAPTSADLTADGALDWAHWGLDVVTDFDHKSSAALLSDYTVVGGSAIIGRYTNNQTAFDWSDGTPHATAQQSTSGIYLIGTGSGFSMSAPADQTERTLALYISVYRASGSLHVRLSDGSAADYTDAVSNQTTNTWRLYTVRYRAASSGQTLVTTWMQTASFDPAGNITLQAAALK
jgi:hypothetical protein